MVQIYGKKSQPHKQYFAEPTKAAIKSLDTEVVNNNLVDKIIELEEGQGLIIDSVVPRYFGSARKFIKHGDLVHPGQNYGLHEIVQERQIPVDHRRQAFDSLEKPMRAGYMFQPWVKQRNKDNRRRRVSLVECLEGSRLYVYASNVAGDVEVGHYHNAKAVATDGAIVPVRVPSRRKKIDRYHFNLVSVPVENNDNKFEIASSLSTHGHDCERKLWHIRYSRSEFSHEHVFCAHEIAAYRQLMDEHWGEGEKTPTVMSQFAQPTEKTIGFYKRLLDSVLVRDHSITAKDHLRKPNKAEEEIMLWGLVYKKGHDETFFRPKGAKKLKDEDWELRHN